jgi:amino acid transporter
LEKTVDSNTVIILHFDSQDLSMQVKFGTFKGVFVPSSAAILGAVIFLLMPALTADAGLLMMLAIVILSHFVTVSTTFSIADCATNLVNIGGGGLYYLTKRSLGLSFGGSIGIQLYLAQAASIGFYTFGFAEALEAVLLPWLSSIPGLEGIAGMSLLKPLLATTLYIIFFIIVMTGADFTLKIQIVIFLVLMISLLAVFLSPLFKPQNEGIPVFVESLSRVNLRGNRPVTIGVFFLLFTQFFPAVTGISTGLGMSGELKNPKKSLVNGTFLVIAFTFVIYIGMMIIFALIRKDFLVTHYEDNIPRGMYLLNLLGYGKGFPRAIPGVMVLIGILMATGSSALSCFVTAPRTIQNVAQDGLLPRFLDFMKWDFKKRGREPRFALLVTFFLGLGINWLKDINTAAIIVGIAYLAVYSWVNLAAFLERISQNPSFRPTFRSHWSISLLGFLLSIGAICLFSWWVGILIMVFQYLVFQWILKWKMRGQLEGVWWGVLFSWATLLLKRLNRVVQGSKNWRPVLQAIAFHENEDSTSQIVEMAHRIASYKGLVSMHLLMPEESLADPIGFPIHVHPVRVREYTQPVAALLQSGNPGEIMYNTLLLEYNRKVDNIHIIKRTMSLGRNILLLENGEKLHSFNHIDIWWRGESNGNLMVLLTHMIRQGRSRQSQGGRVRIIRIAEDTEDFTAIENELQLLLDNARIQGQAVILPRAERSFFQILDENSSETDLIMMGLPGQFENDDKIRRFSLDKFFFSKQIKNYEHLPAILFVKCATRIQLLED